MIADKDGNVVPVAALKINAGLRHAGNNVWRVSAFKQATKQIINTVTDYITLTRDRSLTKDAVTHLETRTQMKPVSKIEATQRTRNAFEEVEKTVTNTWMATRNQTRSVAASEHTATKQVTLVGTHPESSVTDIVTRERTVTRIVGFGFLVTGPATITRGVAFDLDIQSYKIQSGQLDTPYVPDTIVQIDAAYSDPLDDHTPYSTNNVGWSDGKKTVSVTVGGGADSDLVTFWIHDPNSSREGFLSIPIAAGAVEIGPGDKQQYLGIDQLTSGGTNEWDAAAEGLFRKNQIDGQAAFEADAVLGAGGTQPRSITDSGTTVDFTTQIAAGYLRFPVSDPQKLGLLAVRLKADIFFRIQQFLFGPPGPTLTEFSRYAWTRRLVLSPSEAGNTYPSGLAMKSMAPTTSVEGTWINQQQDTAGGTPGAPVDIYIDIPKSWIADLVGNTLYLWFYIAERDFIPYTLFKSKPTQGKSAAQKTIWDQTDARLVLYT